MYHNILIYDEFSVVDKDGIFLGKLVFEVRSEYILCYKIYLFSTFFRFHDTLTGHVVMH